MKTLIIIFVIISIIGGCFSSDTMAQKSADTTDYISDINEHWAEDDMETLRQLGVLKGYNTKARPDDSITRAEFTALIVRSIYKGETPNQNESYFDDVDNSNIFKEYINIAYENGIISGVSQNLFSPESLIKREEIAIIISRLNNLNTTNKNIYFTDINKNYIYYDNIKKAVSCNILDGYPDNTFKPKANAKRAEAVAMIVRALKAKNTNHADADAFVKNFYLLETTSVKDAIPKTTGQAKSDLEYIESYENKDKNYMDINSYIIEKNGMLLSAHIKSNVEFVINKDVKNYICQKKYDLIKIGESYFVYNIDTDFLLRDKINLTWEVSRKAPAYTMDGLTHISPSVFEITSKGYSDIYKNIGLKEIKLYDNTSNDIIDYSNKNNYDIWAMYKTDFSTDTANKFLNNSFSRKSAIDYIYDSCIKNGYSGINVDFENMNVSDRDIFSYHLRELELALHEIGVILSADITKYEKTSSTWSMCYDRDKMNNYCDYLMLMAYDQYYAGSKKAGPVGGLTWVEKSIETTLKEVSNEKLILGMPFYTRYWESKNGRVVSTKAISMESAIKMIKENAPTFTYIEEDKQHKVSWRKGDLECSFWFETAETIGKRVALSKKYNLSGVASWRRGFETADVWKEIDEKL